jgi:hypothetical protein
VNHTMITLRSATSENRSVALVDDACQSCRAVGTILHFQTEDWRICLDCLTRHFTQWTIVSYPIPQQLRELVDADTPTLFADDRQQAALTPVERSIIRQAVSDHASTFFGGVFGFGEWDAARYTAETYVHTQINDRRRAEGRQPLTLSESIDLTTQEIDRQPHCLTTSMNNNDLRRRIEARVNLASQLVLGARDACRAGDYDRADALINLAETTSPTTSIGRGYDYYRSLIATGRTAANQATQ